jgi:hypothetical protein
MPSFILATECYRSIEISLKAGKSMNTGKKDPEAGRLIPAWLAERGFTENRP